MTQIKSRRKEQDYPLKSNFKSWPRKKVGNNQKIIRIAVPRFESWERRLLARFSGSD